MKFIKEHIFEIIGLLITICGIDAFIRFFQYQYAGYILAGIVFVWLLVFVLRNKFIKPKNKITYIQHLFYPYCVECDYELDTNDKKAIWVCAKCGKKVKIPKRIWHDPNDKVAKIFKSGWRKK